MRIVYGIHFNFYQSVHSTSRVPLHSMEENKIRYDSETFLETRVKFI